MKFSLTVLVVSLVMLSTGQLFAADPSPPKEDDFKVVEETVVRGEFIGCNPQVGIPMGDKLFICTTFGFSPSSYYPKAIIFKNKKGEYKVLINGMEYMGFFK